MSSGRRKPGLRVLALAVLLLCLPRLEAHAHAAREEPPLPQNGNLAYLATGSASVGTPVRQEIRVMNPDGSEVLIVQAGATGLSSLGAPYWSPDGSQIAFLGNTDPMAPGEIYLVNADGGALRKLTDDPSMFKGSPAWFPDGSQITYMASNTGHSGLYTVPDDGGTQRLVMELEADASHISWSPDGSRLAYTNTVDKHDWQIANTDIYVMNSDGSGQTRLTDSPRLDSEPEWSPDGSKILFTTQREGPATAIYMMNADGSEAQPVIPGHRCAMSALPNSPVCLGDEQPAWSPDGTMIAFVGFAQVDPGFSDVFVVNADGTNERRLTYTEDFEWAPAWQPRPPVSQVPPSATASPEATPLLTTVPTPGGTPQFEECPSPLPKPPEVPTPSETPAPSPSQEVTPPPTEAPIVPSLTVSPGAPPKVTPANAVIITASPEPFPAITNSNKCKPAESDAAITVQAVGLIALGVLTAGSLAALPFAAARRRRS
jgi:WD40-like Beta Propeller Repeat